MHQDQHGQQRLQAILDIVNKPNPTAAQQQLATLQLDGIPSQQQIFHDIESRLLLPKRSLPDHWLSTYQVYVSESLCTVLDRTYLYALVTGNILSQSLLY